MNVKIITVQSHFNMANVRYVIPVMSSYPLANYCVDRASITSLRSIWCLAENETNKTRVLEFGANEFATRRFDIDIVVD